MKNRTVLFFGFFLFLGLLPFNTMAMVTATGGVMPAFPDKNVPFSQSWFIYNLNLGESKMDAIRLINDQNETVVYKIYAVDAVSTVDGAFALLPEEADRKDVGGWTRLAVNEIELGPQTEKLVPFVITIPKNSDVGDHAGGIVIQQVETNGNTISGTGMRIINRVGVRIYQTVPGEVRKGFEITRFDWRIEPNNKRNFIKDFLDINRKTFFFTGIKNTGNVRITPTATIDVKNIFGMKTAHLVGEIGTVFPGGENQEGAVVWEKAPFFGRYTIKNTVSFQEEGVGTDSREIVIWVFPYRAIFIGIILVVLFMLIRLIALFFREAAKEKMPIYKVKLGDNLADLGQKFFVPWRKIAKLNFIGEPFEVKEGEKLFIPINKKNREILKQMKERGELLPAIIERAKDSRFKRKRTIIIISLCVIVVAGAAWGIKIRRDKVIHQEVTVPPVTQESPKETPEKTKAGAFKKSGVDVLIVNPNGVDKKSSEQLLKKYQLMGYKVKLGTETNAKGYEVTTIEYKPEKKEQADMVKNDLGLKDVNMQEVPNSANDAVIYNFSPANTFFDFDAAAPLLAKDVKKE